MSRQSSVKNSRNTPSHQTGNHLRQGQSFMKAHRFEEAIEAFEAGLAHDPSDTDLLFATGNAARAIGHLDAAVVFYSRVLLSNPTQIEAVTNLANVYRELGKHDDASEILQSAIQTSPSAHELWLTIGNVRREIADNENALLFFEEALRIKPDYALALASLGDLAYDNGDHEGAIAYYREALRHDDTNAQIHLNLAVTLLSLGNISEGWKEYDWRHKVPSHQIKRNHGLVDWTGAQDDAARVVVCVEQGIGDQIMFASCFADLEAIAKESGTEFIIECEPRLLEIFERSFPSLTFHTFDLSSSPSGKEMNYAWLPLSDKATKATTYGGLATLLRTDINNFPLEKSYLTPLESERDLWTDWLKTETNKKTVGICWRSGNMSGQRALQFAGLKDWAAFVKDDRYEFVNLQYDATEEEIIELENLSNRKILRPAEIDQKQELNRVTGLIGALDAVVTAPTAVATIAAALGKPTYKILYHSSWTALGENFEPFAPACRLMTPPRAGDWPAVFSTLTDQL